MNISKILSEQKPSILDVRTPAEFSGGHVAGSINIPLQEINHRIEELSQLKMPLILCCASGGRSGVAQQVLSASNIECYNAGSWLDVNYLVSKTTVE